MKVSRSAYYAWRKSLARSKPLNFTIWRLRVRLKTLFDESRGSLGSRGLLKRLRQEGFVVGRYRVRTLMKRLNLRVQQRRAYKATTVREPSHGVVDNPLNRAFNPHCMNQVWAGDITYLRTREGWLYLAIVMDLHSRRIIGWALSAHITTDLVLQALQNALVLRQPSHSSGLMFHSDRGSQYTSQRFQKALALHGIQPSMSGKGACYDNAVVERFFGSLKHDWLRNLTYLTRADMTQDVRTYIRYYNHQRLHTANGDLAPVAFEQMTLKNVS